jgi:hypothetical protein
MASIFRHGDKPAAKKEPLSVTLSSRGGTDRDRTGSPEGQDARDRVALHFQEAVEQGYAVWQTDAEGRWELHLATGDIFVLADEGVTRRR